MSKLIITIFIILIFFSYISCNKKFTQGNKIIYTSIEPIKYLIDFISNNKIEVKTIINKNFEPHTFEVLPKDLEKLAQASVYLSTNLPFETIIIEKIKRTNSNLLIYNISEGIELIENIDHETDNKNENSTKNNTNKKFNQNNNKNYEQFDIHIWVSLINLKIILKNIYEFIKNNYPDLQKIAKENSDNLILKIDNYIDLFNKIIKEKNIKFILVYHPILTYFSKDFNIKQILVEIEGKEPTLKDLNYLFKIARMNNIKVFITSPHFPTSYEGVFKKELNLKIEQINILNYNIFETFDNLYRIFQVYY
ncbi:MAG: zinc ABC transporter substrate-binding protein [Spirochaetes bacterium]|nr:zinc ABC transporter substrate-binding protein [Spirochaetota bacterium]